MSWWQIALVGVGGWVALWKTAFKLAVEVWHPPWVVYVAGGTAYESSRIIVGVKRKWRESYGRNRIVVGTLCMELQDFDEKFIELREAARDRARQLNLLRERM